ncbi:MAG: hypothetical protein ABI273_07305 [Lacunisphaera sp.]
MKRLLFSVTFAVASATSGLAAPILKPGVYDARGNLEDLSSLQVEVTATNDFIATFVWYDHVVGPNGLERHVTELSGKIMSPKKRTVVFASNAKPLRWPLDQEFEVVSDSEIRTAQGYLSKGPEGWTRRPEDSRFLVMKKTVKSRPPEITRGM